MEVIELIKDRQKNLTPNNPYSQRGQLVSLDYYSIHHIIKRKSISPEFYKKWLNYNKKWVHLAGDRSDLPLELQLEIANGKNIRSRQALAHNPNAAPEVLKILAEAKLIPIKSAIYHNPNTPSEIKEKLRPLVELEKAGVVDPHIIKVFVPNAIIKFVQTFEIEKLPFGKAPFCNSRIVGERNTI